MDIKKGERLRENWDGSECLHLHLQKERVMGSETGDYICEKCGKTFTREQKNNM